MARIHVSNNQSGHIIVSFPHDPLIVSKVKFINCRRWHPAEKQGSFPPSYPRPLRERARVRGIILKTRGGTDLRYIQELFVHQNSKTNEIYTHVGTKSIGKIKSLLDSLNFKKGGDK